MHSKWDGRPYSFKFCKNCLLQILLGPFLNNLSHIFNNWWWCGIGVCFYGFEVCLKVLVFSSRLKYFRHTLSPPPCPPIPIDHSNPPALCFVDTIGGYKVMLFLSLKMCFTKTGYDPPPRTQDVNWTHKTLKKCFLNIWCTFRLRPLSRGGVQF